MLNINEEIEQLHRLIESPPDVAATDIFTRLYAWGILSLFNKVNRELETLSNRLDTAIDLDAISIDFNKYCDNSYWTYYWQKTLKNNWSREDNQTEINRMTDYLPNGKEGYLVTPEVLDSFKTAMHQLCDEDRMSARSIEYALSQSLGTLRNLLYELHNKVTNPEPHLYAKLWETIYSTSSKGNHQENFDRWCQEIGEPDTEDLKAKQKQEIYNLLKKGFFRFAKTPTGGEVKKRTIVIGEDDLEVGSEIDKDFETECAKLGRYAEWKEEQILTINYERLGQYIYNNYQKFDKEEYAVIVYFDAMMDLIHEKMAKLKPGLAKYLKRYQEQQDEELLNDCKKIFEPFKKYLRAGISETLIDDYLKKLLFESDVKEEAKKKLSGQSRNPYCCSIVIALGFCYIFRPEYDNADYAQKLSEGLGGIAKVNYRSGNGNFIGLNCR